MVSKKKLILTSAALVCSVIILSSIAVSRMTFYSFAISLSDEVTARPGETVTVEGEIHVTGFYWLHQFELTMEGIDYDYTIEPDYWQDVRIIREWNPQEGVYRVPETFTISIDVPEDASELQIATVTGQEHHSWREVSNSTFFVINIEGLPAVEEPERVINVTDILVPEEITAGEEFSISFRADNFGDEKTAVAISILAPEDWEVEEDKLYLSIESGESGVGSFEVTPTDSAGTISLLLEYPYKEEIINFTRVGPYLEPVTTTIPSTTTTVTEKPLIVELYDGIANALGNVWDSIKGGLSGITGGAIELDTFTPFSLGIIAVLVVIIIWLLWGIGKDFRKGSKKPEKMKKQLEPSNIGQTKPDVFNGIDKL